VTDNFNPTETVIVTDDTAAAARYLRARIMTP